jgi:hypothetical protein
MKLIVGISFSLMVALIGCMGDKPIANSEPSANSANGIARAPQEKQADLKHQTEDANQKLDLTVLQVVLHDLLSTNAGNSPLNARGLPPKEIRFHSHPVENLIQAKDVLERRHNQLWSTLTEYQWARYSNAAKRLVERIESSSLFKDLDEHDSRIHLFDKDHVNDLDLLHLVRAYRPGYSNDGRFAVVKLHLPFAMHLCVGTYLLEKSDDKWEVSLRNFDYYL